LPVSRAFYARVRHLILIKKIKKVRAGRLS
jgi:hypothetical protein